MKIERTKNATRNIMFGTILKIYQIVAQFVMRTAMIYLLGVQYLGLNSLFTSVLQVLNLAELGVGSAMVFSMYKPIADDDSETICALMKLYKIYYRVIGLVVLVLGLILLPFIPKLINGEVPSDINVYILYVMNLIATVLSYWLFAYKNSILQAHQRVDVTNKVMLITETVKYGLQIMVLALFHNYYYYVIVILFTQVLTNVLTALLADKMYPCYKAKGRLSKSTIQQINHRIRDLFTSKIGAIVINSADTIVISAFLGLTILAQYQNYFYMITAVTALIQIIFSACSAGIGNSLIVEGKEKNYQDFKKFTFIIMWLSGVCTACFLCLFQPFMELWVGKDLLLDFSVVICFCIYYFIMEINSLFNSYKDAAGIWHEDRFRPLVTALVNLFLNLMMVNTFGLYGIILSTILAALFVGMPWLLHNLFTVLFERKYLFQYAKKLLIYTIVTAGSCILTLKVSSLINTESLYVILILRTLVCCTIPNLIYFLIFRRTMEFQKTLELINRMTKGKLEFLISKIQ